MDAYLHRLHVQHFGDAALHNQKIWIVDIHLNGTKEIGHFLVEHRTAIDEIFVLAAAADTYLPRYCDLFAIFIANWTITWVCVVKNNGHWRFRYTTLAIFEDQFLQWCGTNLFRNEITQ